MEIPVLETERLRLRGHRANDLSACAAIWTDPIAIRYTSGKPLTAEEAWTKMLRNAGFWPVLGYGLWAIEEKAGGEFIGEVGFGDFRRDLQPSMAGVPELGYILCSRAHGQGYATEAARAAIAWLERNVAVNRTFCMVRNGNAASIRVAGKCGYREFHRTRYKEHDVILFERETAVSSSRFRVSS